MICFTKGLPAFARRAAFACVISACATGHALADQFGDFTYTDNGTSITITDYPNNATGTVTIPSSIVGKPVTAIGTSAFRDSISITAVSMPSTVTSVASNAFNNCPSITSITLSPNLTTIGASAFVNCLGLTSITVPAGISVLNTGTFSSCKNLTSVSLPSGLITIGSTAFQSCTSLTGLTIPANVTTIGTQAFRKCGVLQTINLPASVNSVGLQAFEECTSLTSITVDANNAYFSAVGGVLFNKLKTTLVAFPPGLGGNYVVPNGVQVIGSKAFFTCTNVVNISLPSSLQSIMGQAFSGCTSLLSVTLHSDAPSVVQNSFENDHQDLIIYYPGSASGYTEEDSDWTLVNYPLSPLPFIDPFTEWLTFNQLPTNSDPKSDPNGDGVNLLMAYALNLDPIANLSTSLPSPVFSGGHASITYWSGADVTYRLEWSYDLTIWYAFGVTVSAPDENQMRTATVDAVGPKFFVRLAVDK